MNVPTHIYKRIVRELDNLSSYVHAEKPLRPDELRDLRAIAEDAQLTLMMLRPRKGPAKQLAGPTRKQERAAKKAAERAATDELRGLVRARDADGCPLCGFVVLGAGHLHHFEGGNGRRRQEQGVHNTALVHPGCHRAWHDDPRQFNEQVRAWARRHGYCVPRRHR